VKDSDIDSTRPTSVDDATQCGHWSRSSSTIYAMYVGRLVRQTSGQDDVTVDAYLKRGGNKARMSRFCCHILSAKIDCTDGHMMFAIAAGILVID